MYSPADRCGCRLSAITMDAVVRTLVVSTLLVHNILPSLAMTRREKQELRAKALEMFQHAYQSYMENAYPADELMPLSCKGRYRGTQPSRGDIDDALGNFSLTLIDTLDTLVVLGLVDEFEKAVRLVIDEVSFDSDIVVSVFETNIRVMGGLLGGHLMADFLKHKKRRMVWYNDELLKMAEDLGDRLLPAFNTSTGMPYPRVNLRYGVKHEMSRTGSEKDTCTACAGTTLLEFSALSRLTGNKIYEDKASRAMDYLWESRHRASDLVGTVINIHNGDWVRRESGIGAGIDSYYEYLLKGYIMLGKDMYLDRFNKHYKAVMKYVSNGPLMLDVHMHRPQMNSRNFMDALLAFWPGLQVLKGDLKSAIEIHEMLYQVTQRHNFLPEAFTADFRVHWAQHPLRPEFLESTYFIYKATGDPYYLEVGKSVIENLDRHARVPCGFAAIKDVTTGTHEDQMDSYVLAETFKYLFLLFSEKEDLILNVDDYVFTTEAHLLPLFLSLPGSALNQTEESDQALEPRLVVEDDEEDHDNTCPSTNHLFKGKIDFAHQLRSPLKNMVENLCPKPKTSETRRIRAAEFMAGNQDQIVLLNQMGIRVITMSDGRVQLLHMSNEAASPEDSAEGLLFMQEMMEMSKAQTSDTLLEPRIVQLMSPPFFGSIMLKAGPAQFGVNLKNHPGIEGPLAVAAPLRACQPLANLGEIAGKFVMVERGDCMFVDKARHLQNAGAIGGIIFDNNSQSSADSSPLFSMSGDGKSDIIIPLVFLFRSEAKVLLEAFTNHPKLLIYVSERFKKSEDVLLQYLSYASRSLTFSQSKITEGPFVGAETPTAEAGATSEESESDDVMQPSEVEAGVKDLILLLLRKLNVEQLQPFIKTRSRDKLDMKLAGSFQVRVIRMPENVDGEVQMNMRNEEDGQRIVRVVFTEVLLLLMECTNLRQMKDLNQLIDAIARLTESVFTQGQMGYGVHTETLIGNLREQLRTTETCLSAPFPATPDLISGQHDVDVIIPSGEVTPDGVQLKISVVGDDGVDADSQELRHMVSKFMEDQIGVLVKELRVSSSVKVSSVEVVVASNADEEKCDAKSDSLFPEGYRLENENHRDEIKKLINSPVVVDPSGSESDGVSSDKPVANVCDDVGVVDDLMQVTFSDVTGETTVKDASGTSWKFDGSCWRREPVAVDDVTLDAGETEQVVDVINELDGMQVDMETDVKVDYSQVRTVSDEQQKGGVDGSEHEDNQERIDVGDDDKRQEQFADSAENDNVGAPYWEMNHEEGFFEGDNLQDAHSEKTQEDLRRDELRTDENSNYDDEDEGFDEGHVLHAVLYTSSSHDSSAETVQYTHPDVLEGNSEKEVFTEPRGVENLRSSESSATGSETAAFTPNDDHHRGDQPPTTDTLTDEREGEMPRTSN